MLKTARKKRHITDGETKIMMTDFSAETMREESEVTSSKY